MSYTPARVLCPTAVRAVLICLLVSTFAPRIFADVIVFGTLEPAPHLATHWLITLTAFSDDPAEPIIAFDFGHRDGEDPSTDFGIFGSMNEVNPLGSPTVFQDVNLFFPSVGAYVDQDSQFLFSTLSTDPLILVAPQRAHEDAYSLQADFAFREGLGQSVPFAQIVALGNIAFRGEISVIRNGTSVAVPIEGGVFDVPRRVPEPTETLLVCVAAVLSCAFIRSRSH